jgi:hypothetical protein
MKPALIRCLRTFLQVFVGLLIVGWAEVGDVGDALTLASSAAVAAIPAVLSLIQNLLEDKTPLNVGEFKG